MDEEAPTPEDIVIANIMAEKIHKCLALLSAAERDLIHALFYSGKTVMALANELGIPRRTLGDRRERILNKLKKMMES